MILRRQPAVASPISPMAVAHALIASLHASASGREQARALVARRYDARGAVLTDSGTSALVHALRLAVPSGGIVGFPAYACVDLAAAARYAGVRVRLYDLDPATLSPDLESVRALVQRGVSAIVVAHLFGYPADVPGVREIAAPAGAPVIEDAAQGTGGSLDGRRLGTMGDLAVLSFGRGKGLCAGGGGALLAFDERWSGAMAALPPMPSSRGWTNLATTAVQWALGRPSVYAFPSMLPWLRLGEMVYHPAHEPRGLSAGSGALLASAFAMEAADVETRRRHARVYDEIVRASAELAAVTPVARGVAGCLRYPVRDLGASRAPDAALGIVRPYPRTLAEQDELQPVLMSGEPSMSGATELRRTLVTLPTHRFVSDVDHHAIRRWLCPASHGENDDAPRRRDA
ncbi:MAG TPA: DegT/DnrJ/EryC1/StrS family aminotransferase [Gemmatimonadaceae bacterium]|nr:DegT/DnrJ/EryC1/StrS family aminotransferase [Gemmatimonadaceae bacterium]